MGADSKTQTFCQKVRGNVYSLGKLVCLLWSIVIADQSIADRTPQTTGLLKNGLSDKAVSELIALAEKHTPVEKRPPAEGTDIHYYGEDFIREFLESTAAKEIESHAYDLGNFDHYRKCVADNDCNQAIDLLNKDKLTLTDFLTDILKATLFADIRLQQLPGYIISEGEFTHANTWHSDIFTEVVAFAVSPIRMPITPEVISTY